MESLSHLSEDEKAKLLTVLDKYPECFSETPGLCDLIHHKIHVSDEFRPKCLRSHQVHETFKTQSGGTKPRTFEIVHY